MQQRITRSFLVNAVGTVCTVGTKQSCVTISSRVWSAMLIYVTLLTIQLQRFPGCRDRHMTSCMERPPLFGRENVRPAYCADSCDKVREYAHRPGRGHINAKSSVPSFILMSAHYLAFPSLSPPPPTTTTTLSTIRHRRLSPQEPQALILSTLEGWKA